MCPQLVRVLAGNHTPSTVSEAITFISSQTIYYSKSFAFGIFKSNLPFSGRDVCSPVQPLLYQAAAFSFKCFLSLTLMSGPAIPLVAVHSCW